MESLKNFSFVFTLLLLTTVLANSEAKCNGGNNPGSDSKQHRHRIIGQDFGVTIAPFMFHDYIGPWRHFAEMEMNLGSNIETEKDKFQINLNVQNFLPNEITVKTADGYIMVEAKHDEKEDEHGFISRQFIRRYEYALPADASAEAVLSQLSSDGVLTISAPRKAVKSKERIVPITQTGPFKQESTGKKYERPPT